MGDEVDAPLRVVLGRPQGDPGLLSRAREVILREVRPVDGRRLVGADQGDGPVISLAAQHVCGGQAGCSCAHDNDGRGRSCRRGAFGGAVEPLADVHALAYPLDPPAGDWIERWRTQGFTGPQAEAGVVPGATYGLADNEPFGKRAVVVRAEGPHRGERVALADEENLLTLDQPNDHRPVGHAAEGDAGPKVRLS